eukprot:GSChrysophyteH1.ASY1.ANO1.1122.1 assembled CDS
MVGWKTRGKQAPYFQASFSKCTIKSEKMESIRKIATNDSIILTAFGCISILYILTASPSIAGGDSGELVAEGCSLGTAHPPGYPLFTLLTWASKKFGFTVFDEIKDNVAYRMNILSCLLTSGAAGFMGTSKSEAPVLYAGGSIVAMGLFSFSPLIWQYAVTAEVFPLNTFFAALILWLVLRFSRTGKFQLALLGAFVCGLALTNQHTIVLYEAPLILWMLWLLRHKLSKEFTATITPLAAAFFGGLLPYLYLPLSTILYPGSKGPSWGNVDNWSGFWHHFLRRDYGTLQLYSGKSGKDAEGFAVRTNAYLNDVTYVQGLYIATALAIVGITKKNSPRKEKKGKKKGSDLTGADIKWTPMVLFATQCFYFGIFHTLSNLPLGDKLLFGVHQRFWMQPNVLFFSWVGIGFNEVFRIISQARDCQYYASEKNEGRSNLVGYLSVAVAAALVITQYHRNIFVSDQSDAIHFQTYARAILDPLPKNSLLLVNYDMQWTSLRYISQCEGYRPDVTLINLSMMTYSWFTEKRKYFKKYTWPGTYLAPPDTNHIKVGGAFTLTQFLEANIAKGVGIYLGGKLAHDDPELKSKFQNIPTGLVNRFVPSNASPNGTVYQPYVAGNWQHVLKNIRQLPNTEKYTEETWEWTIGRDFKDRVIDTAAFFLESSISVASTDPAPLCNAVYWLESAILLETVDKGEVPTSLHKNAGLGHLHLVQSSNFDDTLPLPLDGDWFNSAESIGWPTAKYIHANEGFDYKKWSAEKFMYHWGIFLSRDDARLDHQYETIKNMYDSVNSKVKKKPQGTSNQKGSAPKQVKKQKVTSSKRGREDLGDRNEL